MRFHKNKLSSPPKSILSSELIGELAILKIYKRNRLRRSPKSTLASEVIGEKQAKTLATSPQYSEVKYHFGGLKTLISFIPSLSLTALFLSLTLSIPGFENIATLFGRFPEIERSDCDETLTEGSQDIYPGSDQRNLDFKV
ncbi:hypothetical protein L2E82_50086 [Cichorium intybus]|nr:hypothetical protein L2E82_50086 [Cichorium intybus]